MPTPTRREAEVLELVRQGLSNRQIGERLGLTENAVRYHLKELHSKLETGSNRTVLTRLRSLLAPAALGLSGTWVGVATLGAAVVGLGVLAYVYRPAQSAASTTTTTYFAWDGATLASFAVPGRITVAELEVLNPDWAGVTIPAGSPVRVPVLPGATVITIAPTPQR